MRSRGWQLSFDLSMLKSGLSILLVIAYDSDGLNEDKSMYYFFIRGIFMRDGIAYTPAHCHP